MKSFLILLFMASAVVASDKNQALKPFDRLGRDNVRLISRTENDVKNNSRWQSYYGSHHIDKTVTKKVFIECEQVRAKKQPVTVEVFFEVKGSDGTRVVGAGEQRLEDGEGLAFFSESARSSKYRYRYTTYTYSGYSSSSRSRTGSSGEKITGWLARAISDDGRVIGVASSIHRLKELAENPQTLISVAKIRSD